MKIVDTVLEVQSFFPEVGTKIAILVGLTCTVLLAQASKLMMTLPFCLLILYLFSSFPLLFPNRVTTTFSPCSAFFSQSIMRRENQVED